MTTHRGGGLGALAAIACYTVDSDDSDNEDMDVEEDPVTLASQIIEVILNKVTGGDIKMEIKEEPLDIKEEPEDYENIVVTPYVGWMTDSIGYRDPTTIKVEDDSEDSESDSDSSSTSDSSEDEKEESSKVVEEEPKPSNQPVKSKNEIGLSDLPPITDLHITVPEEECVKMGTVASCVQELVVIESVAGHPALDLDTVLFLDFGKRTLGQVFDVIGPVNQPLYCVRFNSVKHIQEKEVLPGMAVFYAPKTEHTSYVFLEQLMKMKISDASWANDEEPPPNFLDYSDDEEERKAKQEYKLDRMKKAGASEEEVAAKRAKFTKGRNRNETAGDRLPGAVEANKVVNKRDNKNNRNSNNRGQSGSNSTFSGYNNTNGDRRGNGLYGENNNPFYRRSRTYDPKENGPIRWGSAMPAGVPTVPNLSTPPPTQNTNPSAFSNTAPSHHPPFGAAAAPRQQQIYGQPSLYHQQQQNQHRQQPPKQQNQWRNQPPKQNQWQQQSNQGQQPSQQNQWQQQPSQQNQWQEQPPQQNQWQQQQPPQQNQWQQEDQWQARPQQNLWQQPQQSQAPNQPQWQQSQAPNQPQWQQSQAPNQPQWQQSQPQAPRQRNWQQTKNPQNEMKGYRTASPPPPPPGT